MGYTNPFYWVETSTYFCYERKAKSLDFPKVFSLQSRTIGAAAAPPKKGINKKTRGKKHHWLVVEFQPI